MKIIGVEFRLLVHDPKYGPQTREIGIVPCNIEAHVAKVGPDLYAGMSTIQITMHCDMGDITFQQMMPENFLDENLTRATRIKAEQTLPGGETWHAAFFAALKTKEETAEK